MTETDDVMQKSLRDAQAARETGRVPEFGATWATAEQRAGAARRRLGLIAGSAAAAVAAVAFSLLVSPGDELRYIDAAELLESTSWSAPSDSLLPEYRFDVYQDIPVLIESTDTYGGALL